MLQQKINEFFESNPEATEVHSALGKLFTDKEAAQKYLGGVHGHTVATHTKPEPVNNTGDSGNTDQQSNDTNNATGGTDADASLPDNKPNETDQNTAPGNVTTDDTAEKIKLQEGLIKEMEDGLESLKSSNAHHMTIKAAQKAIDTAKEAMEALKSGKAPA